MLQSSVSQRVRHKLATEKQEYFISCFLSVFFFFLVFYSLSSHFA